MISVLLCILLSSLHMPVVFAQGAAQNPKSAQAAATLGNQHNVQPWLTRAQERSQDESNKKMKDDIEDILRADPVLDGAQIQATVDDAAITLTGTVKNEAQHQRVIQLVHPYLRWRKLVDKITVS